MCVSMCVLKARGRSEVFTAVIKYPVFLEPYIYLHSHLTDGKIVIQIPCPRSLG